MRNVFVAVALGLMLLSGCVTPPPATSEPVDLAVVQSWSGDYPVAALDRLPQGQQQAAAGYIGDSEAFRTLWAAYKPGTTVPDIDFTTQLVVFSRNVAFYNRTSIFKVTLNNGVAEILAMETMSARPIEDKVALALAVVPRSGVRFLKAGETRIAVAKP